MSDFDKIEFWELCLRVQVEEMREAIEQGDKEHAIDEMVDALTVALDALHYLGIVPAARIGQRMAKNLQKDIYTRDMTYYKAKLAKLLETTKSEGSKRILDEYEQDGRYFYFVPEHWEEARRDTYD